MSHQTNPVGLIHTNEIHNVPILHKLRNHRKCSTKRVDVDGEKPQNIRMASVHPNHTLLAKVLYSGFHKSRHNLKADEGTHLSNFGEVTILRHANRLYSHHLIG